MSDIPVSIDHILEEMQNVQSSVLGDLIQQLAVQRVINRQQEETILMLRSHLEELTGTER